MENHLQLIHCGTLKNDIALLTLDRNVPFTSTVKPICVGDLNIAVNPGDRVLVSGFGLVGDRTNRPSQSLEFVWLGRFLIKY